MGAPPHRSALLLTFEFLLTSGSLPHFLRFLSFSDFVTILEPSWVVFGSTPWAGLSWGLLRRRGCPYAFVPHFRAGGRVSRSFHVPSVAVAMRHACPQVSVELKMIAYVVARQSAQDPVGGPSLRRVVKPPADPIPRWPVARGPVLAIALSARELSSSFYGSGPS